LLGFGEIDSYQRRLDSLVRLFQSWATRVCINNDFEIDNSSNVVFIALVMCALGLVDLKTLTKAGSKVTHTQEPPLAEI